MTTHTATAPQVRTPVSRGTALLRGLLGWLVMCVGLGIAIGITTVWEQDFGLTGIPSHLLRAALMTGLVVPTVLILRSRLDRRSWAGLGWTRRIGPPVALGLGVGLTSGLLAWAPALLAGWIRVDAIDLGAFAWFLLINGLALLFYEALPEELALRGYAWTNLRDGWGTTTATVMTTALFPFGGIVITGVAAGVVAALGADGAGVSAFPADPVVYIAQLVPFGLALIAARRMPIRGALFVAVAFHWTQLTVTRTLLGGMGWVGSGWSTTLVEPDAAALVLVHIILAGAMFVALRLLLTRAASRR
ncbi:MAG: hypothetical protein ABIS84_03390 [Arachnia sp.]